jgi:hypothetical protein
MDEFKKSKKGSKPGSLDDTGKYDTNNKINF